MAQITRKSPASNPLSSDVDGVDSFLDQVSSAPPVARQGDARGRLIFALDATASRQATWDQATALQGDMFVKTKGLGSLDVQLVYYRGFRECKASPWLGQSSKLLAMMRKVRCEAGRTQIERILKHGLAEARRCPVQAMVFVGDCVEEDIDMLGELAGQLKLLGLPVFVFQEGFNPVASMAFAQIAKLSGGVHCQFDQSSAAQLSQLLNAAAVYAASGKSGLQRLSNSGSGSAAKLLEQLS